MRNVEPIDTQKGLAILETVAVMAIIFLFLTVVLALLEYCRAMWNVRSIVDRYIYDQMVRPFTIKSTPNGATLDVNREKLKNSIDQINQSISSELEQMLKLWNLSNNAKFYAETSYAEMIIDQQSGRSSGIRLTNEETLSANGDADIKEILDDQIVMKDKFSLLSKKKFAGIDGDVNSYSIHTAPNVDGRSDNSYLPTTILVGTRVGVSFKGTWIGSFCETIGIDPFLIKFKVVGLRGEIGM